MEDFGGIARTVPVLTFFMVLTALASAGLPGLNGFVGEFLILVGSFGSETVGMPLLIALATTGVILAAVYLLWMLYRMFFGPITNEANRTMVDLNAREVLVLAPLAVLMVIMGVMPQPFLALSEPATEHLLETINRKRIAALEEAERSPTTARLVSDDEQFTLEPFETSSSVFVKRALAFSAKMPRISVVNPPRPCGAPLQGGDFTLSRAATVKKSPPWRGAEPSEAGWVGQRRGLVQRELNRSSTKERNRVGAQGERHQQASPSQPQASDRRCPTHQPSHAAS